MENPPIGSRFSNNLISINFENKDSLSFYLTEYPNLRDTIPYKFSNGTVIVEKRERQIDFTKLDRPSFIYLHGFFKSPEKIEGTFMLTAKRDKNKSENDLSMEGDILLVKE